MRRLSRSIIILFVIIVMATIMAASSYAANGMNGRGNGYYLISDQTIPTYSTSDTIKVRVIVLSRQFSSTDTHSLNINQVVSLTGKTEYSVRDVMIQFNNESTTAKACDYSGNLITSNSIMIGSFVDGMRSYGPIFFDDIGFGYRVSVDGWMFRVNGKNPLITFTSNGGPLGAGIHETPVKEGDVITFFFDCPFTINNTDYSTRFISADVNYQGGTGLLQVQLQSSRDNLYDGDGQWIITPFIDYAPGVALIASLYDFNGTLISTISLDATGYGIKYISLSPGFYFIKVPTKTFRIMTGYISLNGNNTESCRCLNTTSVYDMFAVG